MRHFDLCVIGSGTGNSIIDERFADWQVALVDGQKWFGGTCLNVGCIPTKMFAHPADLAEDARHAAAPGNRRRHGERALVRHPRPGLRPDRPDRDHPARSTAGTATT